MHERIYRYSFLLAAGAAGALSMAVVERSSAQQRASAAPMNVCQFVAEQVSQKFWFPDAFSDPRQDFFVRTGIFDVDGDGISETVVPTERTGTAGGILYDFMLSSSGLEQPFEPAIATDQELFERYGRLGVMAWGWVPYDGRWYKVGFTDEGAAFPTIVEYFDNQGDMHVACAFDGTVEEPYWRATGAVWSEAEFNACLAISRTMPVSLEATEWLADASLAVEQALGEPREPSPSREWCEYAPNPECKNVWRVDYDNDGTMDRLLKIRVASGAGRGCAAEYYVALTPDNRIESGPRQDALLSLQQMGPLGTDLNCGLEYNWKRVSDRYYLETRAINGNPRTTGQLVHALSLNIDSRSGKVCAAVQNVIPRIGHSNPPAP